MKGTSDRGHILGSVDEVLQTLDDNAMQLQGMSASRFVGPFFNAVQNWEKSLSHISEVLDVSGCIFHDNLCSYRAINLYEFGRNVTILDINIR